MRSERLYLTDIIAAADEIAVFVENLSKEMFIADVRTRSATLYQLVVIGEAADQISAELRDRHPEAPWSELRGLRNVATHAYHNLDWDIVWTAVTLEIPELRKRIASILEAEYGGRPLGGDVENP